jgi:hypothetical protein
MDNEKYTREKHNIVCRIFAIVNVCVFTTYSIVLLFQWVLFFYFIWIGNQKNGIENKSNEGSDYYFSTLGICKFIITVMIIFTLIHLFYIHNLILQFQKIYKLSYDCERSKYEEL